MEDDKWRGTDDLTGIDNLRVLWRKKTRRAIVSKQDMAG